MDCTSSDEIEPVEPINLTETMQKILDSICCPLCNEQETSLETVEFCECLPKTKRIHLKCIKELSVTPNGYLLCPNCRNKFNQHIRETEIDRKFRFEFQLMFPVTFIAVFAFVVCCYAQLMLLVTAIGSEHKRILQVTTIFSQCCTVVLYFISMILLYNINSRNAFLRYFDRKKAKSLLQAVFCCEGLCLCLNLIPLFAVKELYSSNLLFAIWLLAFCGFLSPVTALLVIRHTVTELRSVETLQFRLAKADVYNLDQKKRVRWA